jgi:hypothetical protein
MTLDALRAHCQAAASAANRMFTNIEIAKARANKSRRSFFCMLITSDSARSDRTATRRYRVKAA